MHWILPVTCMDNWQNRPSRRTQPCMSVYSCQCLCQSSSIITEYLHREMELPVLWGGMHPTLSPLESIQYGYGFERRRGVGSLEFVQALKVEMKKTIYASPNLWFRKSKN